MESPSPIDSATTNHPKETFTTYSPPKSTAPSEPDPDSSTQPVPPLTASTPRSSGGSKTTTMSSPATEDPSVTSNPKTITKNPATTETKPTATTTEPPETTATTTKDVSTTAATSTETTSDRPVTTESTPPRTSSNVVTITSTPYTTRFITTMSIITVKTVVPKPTMISGSATTIFIPITTTIETPTVVRDPNQPPPGVESNTTDNKPMPPWQVMLIVAACMIVAAAGSAVFLIGRIKKRRRERDAQQHFKFQEQQQHLQKEVMFGIGHGDESVIESSVTDASGAMSNRTLISPIEGGQGRVYDTDGTSAGGLRGWMGRFRSWTPWDSHRAYHGPAHLPGGGHGPPGRLLLMEEDSELGANDYMYAAADMRPVSYQNEGYAGGVAFTQQRQYHQPHQQHYQDISMQGQQGSPRQAASYPLPPLSQSSRLSSASATTAHSNHNINEHAPAGGTGTNASSSPSLLHPFLDERVSTGSDHVDGRGIVSHRASLDGRVLAGNNQTSMYVDPATLEPHSMCEHIRKAPQALPDSSSPSDRAADTGETQERESGQLERTYEEGQESGLVDASAAHALQMAPENDGEASDTELEPRTAPKHAVSLESRRNSLKQVGAAVPKVNQPPMDMVIERVLQGNSIHDSEADDDFYLCPESPIGTIAPDDSQMK